MTAPRTGGRAEVSILEETLGDPGQAARENAELDAAEEFPAATCARLDAFGLAAYYVPAEFGGKLDDHEVFLQLLRTVARRDVSATVAHAKTYLGVAPVWVSGSPEQVTGVADVVLSAGPVGWALSEPEHGADLLNGSCTATPQAGGYRLDGVKWPINNATRADLLTVLARTGEHGGARGHSLFLFDKTQAASGTWRALPKVPTHGIRGIDISGIEFTGAWLPATARIGAEGTGVETVLRALQLTRTMCAVLSLGAGEHALRLTGRFVATRLIQRRPLIERPYPAAILAQSAAQLAAVEAAALVGSRSIHSLTEEMSVVSPVVKALAPTLVDSMLAELAELLGARSFLTGVYEHGAFQKVRRDHQVVSIFDGSTPVNRAGLIQQYPRLVRGFAKGAADTDGLREAVAVGEPVRNLDHTALTLMSRRGCSLVQSLPGFVASLDTRTVPNGLAEHAHVLCTVVEQLHALMADTRPGARPPMAAYELAAAYELCYAGAACLHLWCTGESGHQGEPLWEDGLWVRAALRMLLARIADVLRMPKPAAAPGDDRIDGPLSLLVAEAAQTGAAVTPFGDPMPLPVTELGGPSGR
ncbi:acyl-CoA dehydrogenase family protein [Streptomyces hyaluromycini]|uniref:Acyl-CoA dehydrogenase family protein n=1 Tax=Streptomyces hyaluromycini TaxID=1377993 RepID=A0ABV1WMX7_9ACTN